MFIGQVRFYWKKFYSLGFLLQVIPESVAAGLVQNGILPHDGYFLCRCSKGYGPDKSKRKCDSVLQHGESCKNENVECEPGLSCGADGTCVCAETTNTVFDPTLNRCVLRLGENCTTAFGHVGPSCEQNAICSSLLELIKGISDVGRISGIAKRRRIRKTEERCICAPGYTPNSEGKCARSFHVGCSEDFPCNADAFLTCVNGACQCEQGTTEIFVENKNASCYILPGSPCSTKKGPECVENAVCRKGHCECRDGFSEKSDKCLLTYGKKCTSNGVGSESCNYFQGLACVSSKCACFDSSLEWNSKLKTCVAKEGGRCGKINFSESETDILHRGDPYYPLVTVGMARGHFDVACQPGMSCKTDEEETHDRKHCRKGKSKADSKKDEADD